MTKESKISIRGAILCDDVRKEDNGKILLIGVYSSDILVRQFPFKKNLCLWLHGPAERGEYKIQVRVSVTAEDNSEARQEVKQEIEVEFQPKENAEISISLLGVPLAIQEQGHVIIDVKHAGLDDWTELTRKEVRLHPSAGELDLPSN